MSELFSEKVKAGSRTYFFDVKATTTGIKHSVITESKGSKPGEPFNRNSITVYPEHLSSFIEGLNKSASFILNK